MNFELQNTTRIVFGRNRIADLDRLVGADERVLLLFGGGSIKANGVYDQVVRSLGQRQVVAFGGMEANPEYDTIMEARRVAREAGTTFVLGVGGGSVIDASKFLAAVIRTDDQDPWDLLVSGGRAIDPLPNGAILTLPATGSESNPVSVISRKSRGLKLPFAIEGARPSFAILDSSTMASLSRRQLENGVTDAVTHVLEQYLTDDQNLAIQYGFSEVLLSTLFEVGPLLINAPTDDVRDTVMWAANQALNGLIGAGVGQDWSTHMIGHAITALYGIDHARTLSLVMPHLLRNRIDAKRRMLARFGRRVWKIDGADDHSVALEAIDRLERFFVLMGCPVRMRDLPSVHFNIEDIIDHLERARQLPLGEHKNLYADDIRRILQAAA